MAISYELEMPINVNGKETKTLNIRRPIALDFESMDDIEGFNKRQVKLIANLAGITPDEASKLDAFDYHKLAEMTTGFFMKKP